MCTHGVNRGAHARQSSCRGVCKRYASDDNSAISAFAFARQGSRRAALTGIGASTKANDAICECLRRSGGVPSAIEADMHVVYVRVLFHFMQNGRHGLGASCISALNVRVVSADAGGDELAWAPRRRAPRRTPSATISRRRAL